MKKEKQLWPKIVGGGISGVLEIGLFHPIDTLTKRLMFNTTSVNQNNFSKILFKENFNDTFVNKYKSLYTGAHFGMAYKILQRTYKYGGQSILNDHLTLTDNKSLNQAFTGALIGAGEVSLLPLDVLKIRSQTNPDLIKNKSIINIFKQEGMGLYKGSGVTILRNVPGSFALFGTNSFTKNYIFNLENETKATFFQNFVSSTLGALASITISSPMDVIKVRIQGNSSNNNSYLSIIKDMIKNEGFSSFFKGLPTKSLIIGPKLIFSFTIAQEITKKLSYS